MSENLRSSGYHCVVFGCSNNFTKRKQNRGKWCDEHEKLQRECGCNVFVLHAFPTDPDLRRQWTASINREGFVPNSSSRVCSDHFIDGKRTECNPVPMLRLGYRRKVCHRFIALFRASLLVRGNHLNNRSRGRCKIVVEATTGG